MGYINTKIMIKKILNNQEPNTKGDIYELVKKRIELIKNSKNNGIDYIVTVPNFFNVLSSAYGKSRPEIYLSMEYNKKGTTEIKEFRKCELKNGTKLLEFWHPSYTRISYKNLQEARSRL